MSHPATVTRTPFPPVDHGQGPQSGDAQLTSGGTLPFLMAAAIPPGHELVILSGHTPPVTNPAAPPDSIAAFGDTYTQAVGAFRELGVSLAYLGLAFCDLVQLRCLLVADPACGGRMDNAGFSRAYAAFFGTSENPNLVARTRLQVVGLVNPGWLVELEAVAARRI